jgi:hypothetical protein
MRTMSLRDASLIAQVATYKVSMWTQKNLCIAIKLFGCTRTLDNQRLNVDAVRTL